MFIKPTSSVMFTYFSSSPGSRNAWLLEWKTFKNLDLEEWQKPGMLCSMRYSYNNISYKNLNLTSQNMCFKYKMSMVKFLHTNPNSNGYFVLNTGQFMWFFNINIQIRIIFVTATSLFTYKLISKLKFLPPKHTQNKFCIWNTYSFILSHQITC